MNNIYMSVWLTFLSKEGEEKTCFWISERETVKKTIKTFRSGDTSYPFVKQFLDNVKEVKSFTIGYGKGKKTPTKEDIKLLEKHYV